jgi:hypothetical protein
MMPKGISMGLSGIAGYFVVKSFSIALLATTILLSPDRSPKSADMIRTILPIVKRIDLDPASSAIIALMFALFGLVVVVGIVARQRWAGAYVVAYHGIALVRYLAVAFIVKKMGLDGVSYPVMSRYDQFDSVCSLLMVAYLLTPVARKEFGFS